MNKSAFKEKYSFIRKACKDSQESLHNYPCGYDDYLSEKFCHWYNDWIEKNPIIGRVMEERYDSDPLELELVYRY